jgi:hypothetical protein
VDGTPFGRPVICWRRACALGWDVRQRSSQSRCRCVGKLARHVEIATKPAGNPCLKWRFKTQPTSVKFTPNERPANRPQRKGIGAQVHIPPPQIPFSVSRETTVTTPPRRAGPLPRMFIRTTARIVIPLGATATLLLYGAGVASADVTILPYGSDVSAWAVTAYPGETCWMNLDGATVASGTTDWTGSVELEYPFASEGAHTVGVACSNSGFLGTGNAYVEASQVSPDTFFNS